MQRALQLWDLQVIDSDLERLRTELAGVESQLGESEELLETRQALEKQSARAHALDVEQREIEWDAQKIRQHIKEVEEKLYSGRVKVIKELQALQQDDELLKKRLAKVEDHELDVIDRFEQAELEHKRLKAALADIESRWRESQARLQARQRELEEMISRRESERTAAIRLIQPSDLERYEYLRSRKQGRAAARINGVVCGVCRVELPNAVLQRARTSAEPTLCPSCERILVPS